MTSLSVGWKMGVSNNFDAFRNKRGLWLIFGCLVLALTAIDPVFAGSSTKEMDWVNMAQKLFGGLAIFLYGMELMTEHLRKVAGEKMKDILAKMTNNRIAGVLTGAGVTAVVQSSSVTTVLVVGFVTAGLMNLTQALGVIFGANIGTTITAQIVAFKVTKYALWMVAVGFLMFVVSKKEKTKHWGAILMGLGMVFFGMGIMSGAMKPLRSFEPFLDLMKSMANPVLGILVAAAFTGLVQSSSATTSIVIVMASQGFVTLEAGIALAFGSNIGTCVTAMLACIGKSREAIQAAVAHLLFNVFGVLIWLAFIDQLASLVISISPSADNLTGLAKMGAETPRQIANAHTIFNVVNTLIFLPFLVPFGKIVTRLVPERETTSSEQAQAAYKPKYLDMGMVSTPPLALSMVRREITRMGGKVNEMLEVLPDGIHKGNTDSMSVVRELDEQVDSSFSDISKYLILIGSENLDESSSQEAMSSMATITELWNIGDIVETNLKQLSSSYTARQVNLNEEDAKVLADMHEKVTKAFTSAMVSYEHSRPDAARLVLKMEDEVVSFIDKQIADRHQELLHKTYESGSLAAFNYKSDVLEQYKRIYRHSKRVARLSLNQQNAKALVSV
ncbi:MAG: Na/Pi cotransporter family protein [Magnetococcales bacterium]|nr:Na/Pi cotransporter family protein [Magnetococcales bacterium]